MDFLLLLPISSSLTLPTLPYALAALTNDVDGGIVVVHSMKLAQSIRQSQNPPTEVTMGAVLSAYGSGMSSIMDFLFSKGGPECIKFAHVINLQKVTTVLFCTALMKYYDNWSTPAMMYTALHGSYGLCWLLKESVFPDPGWQRKVTIGGALGAWFGVLGPYWIAPYLVISQRATPLIGSGSAGSIPALGLSTNAVAAPSKTVMASAAFIYALGLALMIGSDAQKYFTLKHKRGLISTGFFRTTRNPNYLGEMMIYLSFAMMASPRPEPWWVVGTIWSAVFLPNMMRKEKSMSRYPEWAAYKASSGLIFPWIPTVVSSFFEADNKKE